MFVVFFIEYIGLPIVFSIECEVGNKLWRCSPIFIEHVSLWCLFFNLHLTTYQSNIIVWFKKFEYHLHTILYMSMSSVLHLILLVSHLSLVWCGQHLRWLYWRGSCLAVLLFELGPHQSYLITLFNYMDVFHSKFSIWHGSPISYLHGKKQMLVQIMNSKNSVNNVDIFNDSVAMNNIFNE